MIMENLEKVKREYLEMFHFYCSETMLPGSNPKKDYFDKIVSFLNRNYILELQYPKDFYRDVISGNYSIYSENIMKIRVCIDFIRLVRNPHKNAKKTFLQIEKYLTNAKRLNFKYERLVYLLKLRSKSLYEKYLLIIKQNDTTNAPSETQNVKTQIVKSTPEFEFDFITIETKEELKDALRLYENKYSQEFLQDFFDWWTQPNTLSGKPRFRIKNFDLEERLELWKRTSYKQNKIQKTCVKDEPIQTKRFDRSKPTILEYFTTLIVVKTINGIKSTIKSTKLRIYKRRASKLAEEATHNAQKMIDLTKKITELKNE